LIRIKKLTTLSLSKRAVAKKQKRSKHASMIFAVSYPKKLYPYRTLHNQFLRTQKLLLRVIMDEQAERTKKA